MAMWWVCHECFEGPYLFGSYLFCSNCSHRRCEFCAASEEGTNKARPQRDNGSQSMPTPTIQLPSSSTHAPSPSTARWDTSDASEELPAQDTPFQQLQKDDLGGSAALDHEGLKPSITSHLNSDPSPEGIPSEPHPRSLDHGVGGAIEDFSAHFQEQEDLQNSLYESTGLRKFVDLLSLGSPENRPLPVSLRGLTLSNLLADGIKSIHDALKSLENKRLASGGYTVFIADPLYKNSLKAYRVTTSFIDELLNMHDRPEAFEETCRRLLIKLGLMQNATDEVEKSSLNLEAARDAYIMLATGLIVYVGSNADMAEEGSFRDWEVSANNYSGWRIQAYELACLNGFVGGPVRAFAARSSTNDTRDFIAMTLHEFDDLWGPIYKLSTSPESELQHIYTERGMLCSVIGLPGVEVGAHWQPFSESRILRSIQWRDHGFSKWQKTPEGYNLLVCHCGLTLCEGISDTTEMVIGAPLSSTLETFWANAECNLPPEESVNRKYRELHLLRTHGSYYHPDNFQVSLGVNLQGMGSIAKGYRRKPGTTMKSALVADLKNPFRKLLPILSLHVGLEISHCSGNARRVSLWRALALSQGTSTHKDDWKESPNSCAHEIGDVQCILKCWNKVSPIRAKLQALDVEVSDLSLDGKFQIPLNKVITMKERDRIVFEANQVLRDLVITLIADFESLGAQRDGTIKAWYPKAEIAYSAYISKEYRGEVNRWINMIKETQHSASFPVFSTRCLQYYARDHRNTGEVIRSKCWDRHTVKKTILQCSIKMSSAKGKTESDPKRKEFGAPLSPGYTFDLRGAGRVEVVNDDPKPLLELIGGPLNVLYARTANSDAYEIFDKNIAWEGVREVYVMQAEINRRNDARPCGWQQSWHLVPFSFIM